MKTIQSLELKRGSKEEQLPGFTPDFPYIASYAELDKFIGACVPWHWHPAVELFYMQSGCLEYTTPGGKWVFPAGSGGFVNSNVLHTSRAILCSESTISLLHLFDPSLIAGEHGSRIEQKYILPLVSAANIEVIPLWPEDTDHNAIIELIRRAFEMSDKEWGYEFKLREILTCIWMKLFGLIRPAAEPSKQGGRANEQIKSIMIYVHENYGQQLSVKTLAETAHISKRACYRLFQENLHMTPVEYITSYRLQAACRMLAKEKMPITEIAAACGLGTSSYFGKLFREKYGCTPTEYKKSWQDSDIKGRI
ncbi:MAG: helix-turn-helix domain-containing protein [Clostridia bacterium]|nr:helix-turn-helix domain-containing protein [Clostridia bacterium]